MHPLMIATAAVALALTHHLPFLRLARYDTVAAKWNLIGRGAWWCAGLCIAWTIASIHPAVLVLEVLTFGIWLRWMIYGTSECAFVALSGCESRSACLTPRTCE